MASLLLCLLKGNVTLYLVFILQPNGVKFVVINTKSQIWRRQVEVKCDDVTDSISLMNMELPLHRTGRSGGGGFHYQPCPWWGWGGVKVTPLA